MGKHLSVEEKLNAPKEIKKITAKLSKLKIELGQLRYLLRKKYAEAKRAEYGARIKELQEEIKFLRERKKKLVNFLEYKPKSKYGGTFARFGICYQMFGKKRTELTKEEARRYDKHMRAMSRAREKENETS